MVKLETYQERRDGSLDLSENTERWTDLKVRPYIVGWSIGDIKRRLRSEAEKREGVNPNF